MNPMTFVSPSKFQSSSIMLSSNTSKIVFVRLTTSIDAVGLGMFLVSARRAELEARRDGDKCKSLRSTKNRDGLLCHPSFRLLAKTWVPH